MAYSQSFGESLRNARERKGIDLSTAARRLRIRPDILRAIEEEDFTRMPPRGYTRNMVSAYARLVGLNPSELSQMYMQEAYRYEEGYGRGYRNEPSGRARYSAEVRGGRQAGSDDQRREEQAGLTGRISYSDRADYNRPYGSVRPAVTPRPRSQGARNGYTNFYSGPAAPNPILSRLPLIIAIVLVVIILIVIFTFIFGGKSSNEEVPDVPITGLTDTSGNSNAVNEPDQQVLIPPTQAVFTYEVPAGKAAYIEIYENGSETPSVAEEVNGPSEQSFNVTSTLRFVTPAPDNVTISVDGQPIDLLNSSTPGVTVNDGVYNYTVDFAQILAAWNAANNTGTAPSTNNNANANANANANTTAS